MLSCEHCDKQIHGNCYTRARQVQYEGNDEGGRPCPCFRDQRFFFCNEECFNANVAKEKAGIREGAEDIKSQVQERLVHSGIMTINEARRLDHLPPIAWGDEKPGGGFATPQPKTRSCEHCDKPIEGNNCTILRAPMEKPIFFCDDEACADALASKEKWMRDIVRDTLQRGVDSPYYVVRITDMPKT